MKVLIGKELTFEETLHHIYVCFDVEEDHVREEISKKLNDKPYDKEIIIQHFVEQSDVISPGLIVIPKETNFLVGFEVGDVTPTAEFRPLGNNCLKKAQEIKELLCPCWSAERCDCSDVEIYVGDIGERKYPIPSIPPEYRANVDHITVFGEPKESDLLRPIQEFASKKGIPISYRDDL